MMLVQFGDKEITKMIQVVIFDMDGVIVDSTKQDFKAWQKALNERGVLITFKDYQHFLGMKGVDIVKKFLPASSDSEARAIQDKKEQYFIQSVKEHGIKPIPGVLELIRTLKPRYKLAVATSAPPEKLNIILKKLGLTSIFDALVNADEVTYGKPHPEIFLKAAQKLNLPPENCMVIEDAPNGVRAAKAGNFTCVAIMTTSSNEQLAGADYVIEKFSNFQFRWLESIRA